jgi:DedD protein
VIAFGAVSDVHEQSYYEIALTNRQVLVAFVILLSCVLAAFFAGVWVGRGAPQTLAEAPVETEAETEAAFEDPKEFEFFADREGTMPEPRPDLRQIAENPDPDTTLAQDLGVEPKPKREPPQEVAGASEPGSAATETPGEAPPPSKAPPQAPAATPTGEAPAAGSGAEILVIQVFSSKDEVQARRLVTTLQEAGFRAFLSPLEADRTTMYRVRIGPFRERSQAESVAERVRSRFKVDTWITSP